MPSVSPVTIAEVAPVVVAVLPPGVAVTVYLVIADPPSPAGAVQDTTAWALPTVALAPVGAEGAVGVVPVFRVEAEVAAEVVVYPGRVAVTVVVAEAPAARPVTVTWPNTSTVAVPPATAAV